MLWACRYRKYKVSAETELVVRCEIDGVLKHKGQDELLSVKALNEFDPKLTGEFMDRLQSDRQLATRHPDCTCQLLVLVCCKLLACCKLLPCSGLLPCCSVTCMQITVCRVQACLALYQPYVKGAHLQ